MIEFSASLGPLSRLLELFFNVAVMGLLVYAVVFKMGPLSEKLAARLFGAYTDRSALAFSLLLMAIASAAAAFFYLEISTLLFERSEGLETTHHQMRRAFRYTVGFFVTYSVSTLACLFFAGKILVTGLGRRG